MGFGNWIRGLFSGGGEQIVMSRWSSPPQRGTFEFLVAYARNPWLHAVVNRLANEVATAIHWELYDRPKGHPKRQQLFDDPLLSFLQQPSPTLSDYEFWRRMQLWRELSGEAFCVVDRNLQGHPVSATPIPPHWVTGTPAEGANFYTVDSGANGQRLQIPPGNVLWLKDIDPANPFGRGVGTAGALADEFDTDEYAAKHLKSWFYNGSMPDFMIGIKGANPEALKEAEERFNQRYGGPRKKGRAHFSGGEVSFHRFDTSFKDMDLVALRKSARDTIVQVFGLPPEVFGIVENSNRATVEAAYYLFAKGALFHRIKTIAGELQIHVVPMFGRRDRYIGFANPVPEDRDFQLRAISVSPTAFTRGELRSLMGFLPGPNADEPLTTKGIEATATNLPPSPAALGDPAWVMNIPRLTEPKSKP